MIRASSVGSSTAPVGLCGSVMLTSFVFGVISRGDVIRRIPPPFSNVSSTKEMSQPMARGVSMFVA